VVRHAESLVSEGRKVKTPALPEEKTSAREQGDSRTSASFLGTDNPRHLRVLQAVTVRPMPREELDRVAGCSNGPDLVAELRRLGLDMPCTRTKKCDRDMFTVWPGVYHLTERDRRKLNVWKRERAAERRQP
jgi:hypothetical protein